MNKSVIPVTALAVLSLLWSVDNLFNGLLQPLFVLAMGGTTTYALAWKAEQPRLRTAKRYVYAPIDMRGSTA